MLVPWDTANAVLRTKEPLRFACSQSIVWTSTANVLIIEKVVWRSGELGPLERLHIVFCICTCMCVFVHACMRVYKCLRMCVHACMHVWHVGFGCV